MKSFKPAPGPGIQFAGQVHLKFLIVALCLLGVSLLLSVSFSAFISQYTAARCNSNAADGTAQKKASATAWLASEAAAPGVHSSAHQPPPNWANLVAKMFPHVQQCGFLPSMQHHWILDYAQMHAAARDAMLASNSSNALAQYRYLVTIPHLSGTADQVISLISQFYLSVVGNRAFLQFSPEGRPPPITAACDSPFFNWTHPTGLPAMLLDPLPKEAQQTTDAKPNSAAPYPKPYDKEYAFHLMVNPVKKDLELLRTADLTDFPVGKSNISTVISTSNRGVTYRIMTNPAIKQLTWRKLHLRPETAFMCGFWSLCSPNAAVHELYASKYWAPMSRPDVLKIGIQVRLGDDVAFLKNTVMTDAHQLKAAAPYFACASLLEQAFAKPGQTVLWFLLSDSASVRKAAKKMYPGKVLTNDDVPLVHVACGRNDDPSKCTDDTLTSSIRNAIGEMLTFSLADYHVITQNSGFGRVGAWLSGNWKHIYTLPMGVQNAAKVCPHEPSSHDESAEHFSGI